MVVTTVVEQAGRAIEQGVAAAAPRGSYRHGVVGRTGSIHRNAREVEETAYDASQPQVPDEIARRIVAHLEI